MLQLTEQWPVTRHDHASQQVISCAKTPFSISISFAFFFNPSPKFDYKMMCLTGCVRWQHVMAVSINRVCGMHLAWDRWQTLLYLIVNRVMVCQAMRELCSHAGLACGHVYSSYSIVDARNCSHGLFSWNIIHNQFWTPFTTSNDNIYINDKNCTSLLFPKRFVYSKP